MARRYSSEYKNLQPYVVEDIRKVVNATGTSGSGGTLEPHGLDSRYHTGELAQTQASWAATKVELANHAALPDVHHARSHSIISSGDHTVTGSQYQIVGLTSTNTLGLLTAASSPTTNQVVKTDGSSAVTLVDLTVTSDLFVTGTLDFGTNTMYEDASYLQVAGSKAVRFSQNIGNANWTVYNAGGASFSGNVDIISGGDLTVVGSGSYAGSNVLFADSSGGNVGILCAPDSQFALDINGPARATYWIGPHALQIKDALMICHYDGHAPFETNFSGEPNGHFGQVGTITGGVIFRPGKFGKALQVGWLCTNYFTDPSCEYDATLSLWSKFSGGGTITATRSTEVAPIYGTYTGKLVQTTGSGLLYQSVTLPAGTAALTIHVRKADKSAVTASDCNLYYGSDQTTTYTSIGDGWYRLVYQGAASGTATQAGVRVLAGKTLYVDGLQCEELRSSPYCDGSLGTGHAWTGTAHASTSTRTGAALAYTLPGIVYDAPVTIMAWVNLDGATSKNYHYLWYVTSDAYSAYVNGSRTLVVGTVDCGTLAAGWHHIVLVTAGDGTVSAYLNGALVNTASITRAGLSAYNVGGQSGGNQCNGLIDDFAIVGRALPAAEIRSIYESNAPIFAETSTFSFRPTPKGLIWADDEGLWMRDSAGSPVLGAYGGEAATKSWAGFTMAAGDIVIGSNAVGSSAIWWDKSAGTFGFYGAGSATAQVNINTSGQITFGGGNSAIDASGLALDSKTSWAYTDVGTSVSWYTDPVARTGYAAAITAGDWAAGGTEAGILFHVSNAFPSDHLLQVKWGSGTNYDVWHGGNIGITSWLGSEYVFDKTVESVQVRANGDSAGKASTVTITNGTQGVSSGTGTVKVNGTTARDSTGWIKVYIGTAVRYIPYWTTVTG